MYNTCMQLQVYFLHVCVCFCVGLHVVICATVISHAPSTGVFLVFFSGCFVLSPGSIRLFLLGYWWQMWLNQGCLDLGAEQGQGACQNT